MRRGAKPAKAKAETKPPVARKSRKSGAATVRDLEKRLAEALEQRIATAEILNVISRSRTDVQPVFEAIIRSAVRLCEAVNGAVFRFDGSLVHQVAVYGMTPEAHEANRLVFPRPPGRGSTTARAILTRALTGSASGL